GAGDCRQGLRAGAGRERLYRHRRGAIGEPGGPAQLPGGTLMRLALALALGPLPALAFDGADCLMDRACFDQSCEATEIPMTLQPEGKGWELAWQQGVIRLTGSVTDPAGTIAL